MPWSGAEVCDGANLKNTVYITICVCESVSIDPSNHVIKPIDWIPVLQVGGEPNDDFWK